VAGTGDAGSFNYAQSVIEYAGPAGLPAADTLKAQLGHVRLRQDASLTPGTVDLIVGSDYTALKPPSATPGGPETGRAAVARLSTIYGGITASASCKSGYSAFQGPLSP
jgi:hypothetical protein